MSHVDAFQDGLMAAKAGKKMVARLQFEQVTELKPDFIHGWLWLAWTADSPEQAEEFLAKAEKLDPKNRLVTVYKEVVTALALYETDEDFSTFAVPGADAATTVVNDEVADDQTEVETEVETKADEEVAEEPVEEPKAKKAKKSAKKSKKKAGKAPVVVEAEEPVAEEPVAEEPAVEEPVAEEKPAEETEDEVVAAETVAAEKVEEAADEPVAEETVVEAVEEVAEEVADEAGTDTKDFEEIRSEISEAAKKTGDTHVFDESDWEDDVVDGAVESTKTHSNAGNLTVDAAAVAAARKDAAASEAEESRIASEVSEIKEDVQATVGVQPEPVQAEPVAETPTEPVAATVAEEVQEEVAEEVAEEAVPEVPTILVVDDSPTVRKLVTMTLKSGGFAVETAEDGVEAMKMLVNFTPDLILLDVNMPRMDGYKLCKLIKRHEKTKFIPVVMLSGKDGMFDKLRGTLVGCNDYISKPFESADLLRHVEEYVYASAD